MKKIVIDLKNYKEDGKVFKRTAVRGIVRRNNEYLVIYSKYGDYKFPGGGREEGETFEETLAREMKEETGYIVIQKSIREFLTVSEKRKGKIDDVLEMESLYYFCEVEEQTVTRELDEYEKELDYQVTWLPLEEIIRRNEALGNLDNMPWVMRENMVMKSMMEHPSVE